MISRFVLAFAIVPGIGIAIGGVLTQWLNWESCFYFLALFGVFMLFLSRRLPETAKVIDRSYLKASSIIEGYLLKLKNRQLVLCSFMMGCGGAIIYIFASKAPFIGINLIGLSPEKFGAYNLIPPLGMICGSFVAAALIGRLPVITIILLIPFALSGPTALSLFLPMVLIFTVQATAFVNVSSYGLSTAKNKSNASAVFNFINIGTILISVLLAEFVFPDSALALPLFFMFFLLVALLLGIRLKKLAS
jgi:MFS family permease